MKLTFNKLALTSILVFVGVVLAFNVVVAATTTNQIYLTADLDQGSYIPGSTITVISSATQGTNLGSIPGAVVSGSIVNSGVSPVTIFDNSQGGNNIYGTATLTAPTTIGSYILRVEVKAPSIITTWGPGVCDSSNADYLESQPTYDALGNVVKPGGYWVCLTPPAQVPTYTTGPVTTVASFDTNFTVANPVSVTSTSNNSFTHNLGSGTVNANLSGPGSEDGTTANPFHSGDVIAINGGIFNNAYGTAQMTATLYYPWSAIVSSTTFIDESNAYSPSGTGNITLPATPTGTYLMRISGNGMGNAFSYDLPVSVIASVPVQGPTITVWTDQNGTNANRADNQKIGVNESTTVYWIATGLGSNVTCSSPQKIDPITGEPKIFVYNTGARGQFLTDQLSSSKTFTVTCKDVVANTGTTVSNGTTGTSTGGGGCFISDTTVVLADGSQKNIQDVKVGDILKGETTNNKVTGLNRPKLDGKLYSINGGRYFVTDEHPFKTTEGWKSIDPAKTLLKKIGIDVSALKVGDTLITNNSLVKVKSINSQVEPKNTQLYNFFLNGDHTYYADGYLVHNKMVSCDTGTCNTGGAAAAPADGGNGSGGALGGGYSCYSTYTKGFAEYNCSVGDGVNGNVTTNK